MRISLHGKKHGKTWFEAKGRNFHRLFVVLIVVELYCYRKQTHSIFYDVNRSTIETCRCWQVYRTHIDRFEFTIFSNSLRLSWILHSIFTNRNKAIRRPFTPRDDPFISFTYSVWHLRWTIHQRRKIIF